jgi:hypothetical protein
LRQHSCVLLLERFKPPSYFALHIEPVAMLLKLFTEDFTEKKKSADKIQLSMLTHGKSHRQTHLSCHHRGTD